jgi:hypothetical protein
LYCSALSDWAVKGGALHKGHHCYHGAVADSNTHHEHHLGLHKDTQEDVVTQLVKIDRKMQVVIVTLHAW